MSIKIQVKLTWKEYAKILQGTTIGETGYDDEDGITIRFECQELHDVRCGTCRKHLAGSCTLKFEKPFNTDEQKKWCKEHYNHWEQC